jgi:hypothetical protein
MSVHDNTMSESNPFEVPKVKNVHAQALGKLGGRVGGLARAAKLSPERRREIAKHANDVRWKRNV